MSRSALTNTGSTRAWRTLRAEWRQRLVNAEQHGNPLLCPKCRRPVLVSQAWDLGHELARSLGGDDSTVRPEHSACNRAEGAQLVRDRPKVRRW
ncbi:hypothetical protein [Enemella evansiae]|uniref:hypothetical protein n=1 Tax=Enemella evansiae TaxID=2016499 RepID=UPI000B968047|nr:hypothetical protein [Enemella evansiae]OYO01226.1 hypothetical protein CGZ97_17480 [Enemella evansiae]